MPVVNYVTDDSVVKKDFTTSSSKKALVPNGVKGNAFYEDESKVVSISADHFSRAINAKGISWQLLPDLGRTGSAITSFPVTAAEQVLNITAPTLQYDIYTFSEGEVAVQAYFSPTLNFQNSTTGLQFALSIDDGTPQILSVNKEDAPSNSGVWNKWVAENIIIVPAKLVLSKPGKHVLKYWMVSSGVVLQKIVLNFGTVKQSYLGPPETIVK